MKFKILDSFQTDNSFYKDNVEKISFKLENDSPVNDIGNYHYYKFVEIDKTWSFSGQKSYIFPIYFQAADSIFIKKSSLKPIAKFVTKNMPLFIDRKLIPVFMDPLEGNEGIAEAVDEFVDIIGNRFPVYCITADYKLKFRDNKFRFIFNDQWIHHVQAKDRPIIQKPFKIYLNCNRVARYHRCMLMDNIIENDLIRHGWNTWADTYGAYDEYENDFPNNKIKQQKFDILDVDDITASNPTNQIPVKHCENVMFYLNTETHVNNRVLFLSEKTYKPISIGMPFMSLGNPGTLRYLHEKGFATFGDFIDESYDADLPLATRIAIIIDNLKMLSSMKLKAKQKMLKRLQPICRHNLEIYKLHQRKNNIIESFKFIEKGIV